MTETRRDPQTQLASTRATVLGKLWRGRDPFDGFPKALYAVDTQGWNSGHPYLRAAVDKIRPSLIVEVGVWKGGSVLTMASRLKELGLDTVIIAVDTWLGSWDHWTQDELFDELDVVHGHPSLYQKFMGNVVHSGLQQYVVPLPLDSVNAAHVLHQLAIRPQVIHIDGGHDYTAVATDLALWWPTLANGGLLIGDDYFEQAHLWPEVRRAFDDFFGRLSLRIEHVKGKCRVRKPE